MEERGKSEKKNENPDHTHPRGLLRVTIEEAKTEVPSNSSNFVGMFPKLFLGTIALDVLKS